MLGDFRMEWGGLPIVCMVFSLSEQISLIFPACVCFSPVAIASIVYHRFLWRVSGRYICGL